MIFLGDELTNIGFPIVHVPLVLKETIRHVCSIEYVHCLLDLICMMISVRSRKLILKKPQPFCSTPCSQSTSLGI